MGQQIAEGNIDLYNRPKVKNPNGGTSTVYSASFNIDGKEVLLPLSDEGRILSDNEAVDKYRRTGKHLGIFSTPAEATAYADRLHRDYESGKYDRPRATTMPQSQTNDLSDDELLALADDPLFKAKGTPSEKGRLSQLRARGTDRGSGPFGRFIENAVQPLIQAPGMMATVGQSLLPTEGGAAARQELGRSIVDPSVERLNMMVQAGREGRPLDALGNAAAAFPVVGPAVAHGIDQMRSGDVAGGAGTFTGIAAPFVAGPIARGGVAALKGTAVGEGLANRLDASANSRLVDQMVPKVGPNKLRLGNKAADIAPKLLRVPDLSAFSRSGLAEKITARLDQATEGLDVAADGRLVSQQVKTGPLLQALDQSINDLTARPVEGSRAMPSVVGDAVRQVPVDQLRQYALRWMKDDMESLPFNKRTWSEAPKKSGNAAGGNMDMVPGSGGAPIYQAVVATGIQATRAEVTQAISDVLSGNTEGRLRQAVAAVADDLAKGDRQTTKLMATSGPAPVNEATSHTLAVGKDAPADMPARAAVPLGQSVEPSPNAAQIGTLRQIRREVAALGPVASYEAVRRIRQAWDQVAKVKYSPAMSPDFLAKQGEATGASKGTGAMRESLAQTDPASAQSYERYSLYKSANDVVQAAEEANRVRPNRGRGMMARSAGAMIGAHEGGVVGAGIGAIAAGIADRAAEMAPTFQIAIARRMAAAADALRKGDAPAAQQILERTITKFPAVKSGLKISGKMTPAASVSGWPLAADSGQSEHR